MKELYEKYVGKEAVIRLGGLSVLVKIEDIKVTYGRERFFVTPVSGTGKIWVETIYLTPIVV